MAGGMHGRRKCMARGVHGRVVCMAGVCVVGGHAW